MNVDFTEVRRVLVVKLRHHGDVLLTMPIISALKRHYPSLIVDALIYEETRPFLSPGCGVGSVYSIDRNWKKSGVKHQVSKELELLKKLKTNRYDLIICLTDQWRLPWFVRYLTPRFSVSALSARRDGSRFWKKSFDVVVKNAARRHRLEIHSDVLRCLGVPVDGQDHLTSFSLEAEAELSVDALLEKEALGTEGFLHVHLPSRQAFKMLTVEKAADLLVALWSRNSAPMVMTSSPDQVELKYVRDVIAAARNLSDGLKITDLSGQLNIPELAAISAKSQCFIGVDSAPMHLAAALKRPVVGIFGASDFYMWGPATKDSYIARSGHSCQPCNMKGCAHSGVAECLSSIDFSVAADKVAELCQ